MSLSRVKVWNPGDVLTAADLNGEFNNVLSNPISLISPSTGPINFGLQAHTNLVPSAVTASSAAAGQALVASTAATPVTVWGSPGTGMRVSGLSGTASSQGGSFSANYYVMQSTNKLQSWVVSASSAITASIGTAGPLAGGRDVAGAFSSTEVHWYAISTGYGSTAPALIVSTQFPQTGPVMPTSYSGYTYLSGSAYSSASTQVTQRHTVRGASVSYDDPFTVVTGASSTGFISNSLSTIIPSNAIRFSVWGFDSVISTGASDAQAIFALSHTSSGGSKQLIVNTLGLGVGHTYENSYGDFWFPNVGQTVYRQWTISTGAAAGQSAPSASIFLQDYTVPNGDV